MPSVDRQAAWARDTVWTSLEETGARSDLPARPRWSTITIRRDTAWIIYRYTSGQWGVDVWVPREWRDAPLYRVRVQGPGGFQGLAQVNPWGEVVDLPFSVLTPTAVPSAAPRPTATPRG